MAVVFWRNKYSWIHVTSLSCFWMCCWYWAFYKADSQLHHRTWLPSCRTERIVSDDALVLTHQPLWHVRLYGAWNASECVIGTRRSIKQIANRTAVTKRLLADDTYVLTHKACLNIREYVVWAACECAVEIMRYTADSYLYCSYRILNLRRHINHSYTYAFV